MGVADRLIGDVNEGNKDDSILESIAETDNEDGGDDEVSEGVTGPITDDATEDETADQGSDDEGRFNDSIGDIDKILYFCRCFN